MLANDPELLGTIEAYLGCKPTLFNINAWWSVASDSPVGAQNFHRDFDDLKFVKYFIYLTDVGDDNGPHVFVEGTHKSSKLCSFGRFSDEIVEHEFPGKSRIFTGVSGLRFLEDTRGIHKGTLPKVGTRLVLQFVYVMVPIGAYPLPNYHFSLNKEDDFFIDPYVSRYYLRTLLRV